MEEKAAGVYQEAVRVKLIACLASSAPSACVAGASLLFCSLLVVILWVHLLISIRCAVPTQYPIKFKNMIMVDAPFLIWAIMKLASVPDT
eukprot:COSAG05_NODE_5636_length_1125_cov_0.801170_1_plen_90_part_00